MDREPLRDFLEQDMNVESTWRAAAACWQRVRRFAAPVHAADAAAAARTRVPVPFCVSYGRAVFCFHRPARDGKRLDHAAW